MNTTARSYLLLLAMLLAVSGGVFASAQVQRSAASHAFELSEAVEEVRASQVDMENTGLLYLTMQQPEVLGWFEASKVGFDQAMRRALLAAEGDAQLTTSLEKQQAASQRYQALTADEIRRTQAGKPLSAARLPEATLAVSDFRDEHERATELVSDERSSSLRAAGTISVLLIVVLGLAVAIGGFFGVVRPARRRAAESRAAREFRRTQDEFSESLQAMGAERDAQQLVSSHLERQIEGASAVVLNRNNSDDRLEPVTRVPEGSPLAARLEDAAPESCLAVRLAREHDEPGQDPDHESLLRCELCGKQANATCVPSLVGGRVIGSVLVTKDAPFEETERDRIRQTVSQAAPVLANMRTLAIAEMRASTDKLTGLPNKRASDIELRRMVAQAARTEKPLSVAFMDLDHFKRINDDFGHGPGDDALAAIGQLLSSRLRASDFAGRYGGEEFLVLLPDTDPRQAVTLAEELRAAVASLNLPTIDRRMTASIGIAAHPEHALDAVDLVRMADRALYVAKEAGRNRVHVAEAPEAGRKADSVAARHNGIDPEAAEPTLPVDQLVLPGR